MALYTPSPFEVRDRDAARQLIVDHPFATLVTTLADAEPRITHLPLLLRGEELHGHMARANPHWQQFENGHTVAVFHGPHAYVSPRWYGTPEAHVPTWNYATVHVAGRPRLGDVLAARASVVDLTAHFDPSFSATSDRIERLLGGIVAFVMPITRLDAKFKMNQNRSETDRAGVIAALERSEQAQDRAVAEWMRTHA